MKINLIGKNQAEVEFSEGSIQKILISYKKPVAYVDIAGEYFRTSRIFSATTEKHINGWIKGKIPWHVSQEDIDKLFPEN